MPVPHTNFDQPRIHSSAAGSAPTLGPSRPAPLTAPTAPRIGTGDFESSTPHFIDNGQMTSFNHFFEHNNAQAGRHYGEPHPRTPGRVNAFGDPDLFQVTREYCQQGDGPVHSFIMIMPRITLVSLNLRVVPTLSMTLVQILKLRYTAARG